MGWGRCLWKAARASHTHGSCAATRHRLHHRHRPNLPTGRVARVPCTSLRSAKPEPQIRALSPGRKKSHPFTLLCRQAMAASLQGSRLGGSGQTDDGKPKRRTKSSSGRVCSPTPPHPTPAWVIHTYLWHSGVVMPASSSIHSFIQACTRSPSRYQVPSWGQLCGGHGEWQSEQQPALPELRPGLPPPGRLPPSSPEDVALTQEGILLCGAPGYMAPLSAASPSLSP